MAKPFHVLLAETLTRVVGAAKENVIHTSAMSRRDRERLLKGGWLQEVITGWYLLAAPHVGQGESTLWYASFWVFVQQYLHTKYGDDYCLSAESSLDIHTASNVIPEQIIVITKSSSHTTVTLPHRTHVVIYHDAKKFPQSVERINDLQVMPLGLALARVARSFFQKHPVNAKIALHMVQDPSQITRYLLQDGMVVSAGRLAGAYRQLGKSDFADVIINTLNAAKFNVVEENPFEETKINNAHLYAFRSRSPYYARIMNMWDTMREDVIKHFPKRIPTKAGIESILQRIDDVYVNDAYNSLSIEGFKISKELMEKIGNGEWNPDQNEFDAKQRDALAAKGYYLAFLSVKESIKDILNGSDVVSIIQRDLSKWYLALFAPSVDAKLIEAVHLSGYRNDRVYIRQSMHVPPPKEAVLDCIEAFFTCLKDENDPIVRAVLGHFVFVFIHPYMDGNGRIGRFLMNTLWIAAGYPWTIVRHTLRDQYFAALEAASVGKNITLFTEFLANEMAQPHQ